MSIKNTASELSLASLGSLTEIIDDPSERSIGKRIILDWANREYIEMITGSIQKIVDTLNAFG